MSPKGKEIVPGPIVSLVSFKQLFQTLEVQLTICQNKRSFFTNETFFLRCCLIHIKIIILRDIFIFTIFMSMSRPICFSFSSGFHIFSFFFFIFNWFVFIHFINSIRLRHFLYLLYLGLGDLLFIFIFIFIMINRIVS